MANQPVTNGWESGIYQWEITDPAQGGVGGVMNTPILQLANRTGWLKAQVDALNSAAGGYAPLNGPAFIGNPTAPTAAKFDADTSIANTLFVQQALGDFAGIDTYASSQTLIAAQAGRHIFYWGSSAGTFVLPAASAVLGGGAYWITNSGSAILTVQRAGSDTLLSVGGATSVSVGPNDSLYVVSLGSGSQWLVFGGSAQLPYTSALGNKANVSGTYPALNVGYASNAGNADTVDGWHAADLIAWGNQTGKPFDYSGQSGQPTWLWGTNDGSVYRVWNPSNFSVAYAASSGSTGNADTVDGYHASQLWREDMAASGTNWFKLPNGWIFQFGSVFVGTDSTSNFTFPVSFPNECTRVLGNGASSVIAGGTSQAGITFYNEGINGASALNDGIGQTVRYMAIGK